MERAQRLEIEHRPVGSLRPYARNARQHSKAQIQQIADSIRQFGFTNPVLVSDDGEIIAGHGRVEAAKLLRMKTVPTVRLSHLSEAQRRAYMLADNKLALNAGWDQEILAIELQALIDLDFDVSLTGFSIPEIDLTLAAAKEASAKPANDAADDIPALAAEAVSQGGDVWVLGRHRVICGDARDQAVVARLMGEEVADLIFTDPPYNVPIDGNVTGLGRQRHREFAMGVGEMSRADFVDFLTTTLGGAANWARDGAIAFVCMDWRHLSELLEAGEQVFSELKNMCVWNKTNAGMGTFYRSKHECGSAARSPHRTNSAGVDQEASAAERTREEAGTRVGGCS
jgi:ParB-like chromosome segregation protein Spo0J